MNENCPFCGAEPRLREKDETRVHASCSDAECWASDWSMPISAWNKRYTPRQQVDRSQIPDPAAIASGVITSDHISPQKYADPLPEASGSAAIDCVLDARAYTLHGVKTDAEKRMRSLIAGRNGTNVSVDAAKEIEEGCRFDLDRWSERLGRIGQDSMLEALDRLVAKDIRDAAKEAEEGSPFDTAGLTNNLWREAIKRKFDSLNLIGPVDYGDEEEEEPRTATEVLREQTQRRFDPAAWGLNYTYGPPWLVGLDLAKDDDEP